jgi:hypothetical protein
MAANPHMSMLSWMKVSPVTTCVSPRSTAFGSSLPWKRGEQVAAAPTPFSSGTSAGWGFGGDVFWDGFFIASFQGLAALGWFSRWDLQAAITSRKNSARESGWYPIASFAMRSITSSISECQNADERHDGEQSVASDGHKLSNCPKHIGQSALLQFASTPHFTQRFMISSQLRPRMDLLR